MEQPDVIRRADTKKNLKNNGLLKSISEEDFKNTDLLVFRESTGQLVLSRRGIADAEIDGRQQMGIGQGGNNVFYRAMLRGPSDSNINIGATNRSGGWTAWATRNQLAEPFREHEADHLKSGEWVRLVAINRATGYVGSQRVQLADASTRAGGLLSFPVDDIKLMPPNLKIWAERSYDVDKGLTSGEERRYLIGAEGASQTSDAMVSIYSEWLDHDGRPLPEGLGDDDGKQYGLTGRLAKVVAPNQLGAAGSGDGQSRSDLASFPIAPGLQKQVIQLRDNQTRPEHYYVHVTGTQVNENPSFDAAGGAAEAPLDVRPVGMTPFLTPLFDEDKSLIEYNAYRDLKRNNDDVDADKPLPYYAWSYRPEYQFSRYSLEMQEVNRTYTDASGTDATQNIYTASEPIVSASDKFVELLYSLMGPEFDRLTAIDGPQDLVFAFGEEEAKVEIGEDKKLKFENLDHLSKLDVEDFLTLRLYSNQDAGNILWEYAFDYLTLFPGRNPNIPVNENTIEISSDEVALGPKAISAFLNRDTDGTTNSQIIGWRALGSGSVDPQISESSMGIFGTSLRLSTKAGDSAAAYAFFGSATNAFYTPTFKTIAGAPHAITVINKTGKTTIGGMGAVDLLISVKDKYGNAVADGTQVAAIGSALNVQGVGATVDGKATLSVKGDVESGSLPIVISAGQAKLLEEIQVYDIELSLPNLANVNVNSTTPFEIKATSDYGNLETLELDVAVHRGNLDKKKVVLDAEGRAIVNFEAGEFPGFAQLSVKIAKTTKVQTEKFFVKNVGDYLERNVLVTDGNGSIDVGGATLTYGDTTNLVMSASPGEGVSPTLVDIFEPPLYALQDYALGTTSGNSATLVDISGGIDARGEDIAITSGPSQAGIAWRMGGSGSITIPDHSRTASLKQAGINFWIKFDAQPGGATILEWDDLGVLMKVTDDGRLRLEGKVANTEYNVTSSNTVVAGKWHRVAAHFYNEKLFLGLDGQVDSSEVGSELSAFNNQDYALKIQAPIGLDIAGIKVYDWHGEAKLTFLNGSFDTSVTVGATGQAKIALKARPALVAYTRAYHIPDRTLIAAVGDFLIPSAYAGDPSTQACVNSFSPVPPDAVDPSVAQAERFMKITLECFVKKRVEQARIKYQTSEGYVNKAVALVNQELYKGVYETLKAQQRSVVIFANCLDAVATGENASAVGATCDFITGMLAIGDIRDLLIQAWHYHIGDQKKYDPLVANLAAIGLIADGVQLIPGAQGGVIINAVTASSKQIVKGFRLLGEAGQRASKLLGTRFGKIVNDSNLPVERKIEALKVMVPFLEITASVALIYQQDPRIFSFLAEAMSSENAVENLISWTKNYLERLGTELGFASNDDNSNWLDFIVPSAYADVTVRAKERFVRQLGELLDGVPRLPQNPSRRDVADAFNKSLAIFLDAANDSNFALKNVRNDMDVLRTFLTVHFIGKEDAVKKLAYNKGWTIGLRQLVKDEHMLKAIAGLDVAKMVDDNVENAQEGLRRIISQLDNSIGPDVVKGHMAHLLVIADVMKRNDMTLKGVEVWEGPRKADLTEAMLSGRRVDLKIQLQSGEIISVELKNFSARTWQDNLKKMMSNKVSDSADDSVEEVVAGQLMSDLVKYIENGNKGRQWWFTPDVIPGANTATAPLSAAIIAAKEDEIIRFIEKEIAENEADIAKRYFGLVIKGKGATEASIDQWESKMDLLSSALKGRGNPPVKFVKIYDFENVIGL